MTETLVKIEELLKDIKSADALKLCNEKIQEEGMSQADKEILAMQSVRCVVRTFKLETLYGRIEDNLIIPSDEDKQLVDILAKYIDLLSPYLTADDTDKFDSMYKQVCGYAHDWFYHFMKYYVQTIDGLENAQRFTRYYQGYLTLMQRILLYFSLLKKKAGIGEYDFESSANVVYPKLAKELGDRHTAIFKEAQALSTNLPFYTPENGKKAVQSYLLCDYLLDFACKRLQEYPNLSALDQSWLMIWKKYRVLVNINKLHAVIEYSDGSKRSFYTKPEDRAKMVREIRAMEADIQKTEADYKAPAIVEGVCNVGGTSTAGTTNTGSGGCYVATAVYGSYDCPQVWTLRRFRDNTLSATWYGRAFIRTYYAISPTLVKWFGNAQWFKNLFAPKLDKMVANLQAKGVESTPYEDKNW